MEAEQRLTEIGLSIPDLPSRGGNFLPTRRVGDLVYTAGNGPIRDGQTVYSGKLGIDLSVEDGYDAARLAALNCLAAVKAAIGDLDRVRAVVKVSGFVNSAADFVDHPRVLDGASDLLVEVFGDRGRHARCAVGMASLPRGMAVEVEMIVQVTD